MQRLVEMDGVPQKSREMDTSGRIISVFDKNSLEGSNCLSFVSGALSLHHAREKEGRILGRTLADNV